MVSIHSLISLTSVVEKLFESIIAKNIRDQFDKQNLINSSLHGFIKSKLCYTGYLLFHKKVYEARDRSDN